jgi:hypothetical protein
MDTSHIDLVIKHPEKFLLTKKDIEDTYKKHKEPIGLEGKAREEILSNLIKQGWVRIRYIPKTDSFTVQLNRIDKRKKDQIASFADQALKGIKGKKYNKSTDVKVLDLNADVLGSWSLNQLSEDALYKEARVIHISKYNPKRANLISRVMQKLHGSRAEK